MPCVKCGLCPAEQSDKLDEESSSGGLPVPKHLLCARQSTAQLPAGKCCKVEADSS